MKMLLTCLLAAMVTVLIFWGGWFFSAAVSTRIAVQSLLQWGMLAVPALTALQLISIRIGRQLTMPMAAPLLAGVIAALVTIAFAQADMRLPVPFWAAAGVALVATVLAQRYRLGAVALD